MKKIMFLISILLIIYIALIFGYRFFGPGHHYQYDLNNNENVIQIDETFINAKNDSNYYLKITVKNNNFYYRTYENFRNQSKIVEDIYYYENDKYNCILPTFLNNRIITDIICQTTNGYSYFYHYLKGMDEDLDQFASSLNEYGYNADNWEDKSESIDKDGIKVYTENISSNHHIAMTDYKGILLAGNKKKSIYHISLFDKDIYQKNLSVLVNNKYIVANYNEKFRFHNFYIIDIITGTKTTLSSQQELSFDSYIQGTIDNDIYLFDRNSKKQYRLSLSNKEIKEVGNETIGIKIYNKGEWQMISATTASKVDIYFEYIREEKDDERFIKAEKYGTNDYGYYYYYKQIDDQFLVYRSDIKDVEQLTYLFTTTNIDNIVLRNDFIYYLDGEYIKKYSDKYGIQKIIEYSELKFNDDLLFGIFID